MLPKLPFATISAYIQMVIIPLIAWNITYSEYLNSVRIMVPNPNVVVRVSSMEKELFRNHPIAHQSAIHPPKNTATAIPRPSHDKRRSSVWLPLDFLLHVKKEIN